MKGFLLSVLIVVAVVLYCGLGILFRTEQGGFIWFVNFLLLSGGIIGLFVLYVIWDSKRKRAALLSHKEGEHNDTSPEKPESSGC